MVHKPNAQINRRLLRGDVLVYLKGKRRGEPVIQELSDCVA
jgi:hypothetical protein